MRMAFFRVATVLLSKVIKFYLNNEHDKPWKNLVWLRRGTRNEDDAAAAHLWLAVSTPHAVVASSRRAVAIKCRATVLPQPTPIKPRPPVDMRAGGPATVLSAPALSRLRLHDQGACVRM